MISTTPSTLKVVSILARTALRRRINRLGSIFKRRRRLETGSTPTKRTATPGKPGVSVIVILLCSLFILPQGVMFSLKTLAKIAGAAGREQESGSEKTTLHRFVYKNLEDYSARFKDREKGGSLSEVELRELEGVFLWEAGFDVGSLSDATTGERSPAAKARIAELVDVYRAQGIDGFSAGSDAILMSPSLWPSGEKEARFLTDLALLFNLLGVTLLLLTLGSANQDLGGVDWSFEWLYTCPAKARTLFLAKALEYALVNLFAWLTLGTLLAATFWASGLGWIAIPLGALAALPLNLVLGSLRILLETWLRKHLSLARLKNLQALLTVVGMLAIYALIYLGIGKKGLPQWFIGLADYSPAALFWTPFAMPLLLVKDGAGHAIPALLFAASGIASPILCAVLAGRSVRNGLLISSGGAYQGSRGRVGVARARARERAGSATFSGVIGKELTLLRRDRNFLVQTLFVPILVIGFQVMLNPAMLQAGSADPRHGAMLAFGIGAYVLLFGGFSILGVEGNSLWLLYTFPAELVTILRQKAKLWAALGALYSIVLVTYLAWNTPDISVDSCVSYSMAIAGVVVYSFLATGLGVIGTNPLEQQVQRKNRPAFAYLYMMLASLYAYGIYSPSYFSKATTVTLCSLVAYAVWQKARERLPFLLDPAQAPTPHVTLADGLMAAFAFFSLQGVIALFLLPAGMGPDGLLSGSRIVVSFTAAGVIVVLLTLYLLWRAKVPNVLAAVGVRRVDGANARLLIRSLGVGIASGVVAAGLGYLYLTAIDNLPELNALRELKEEASKLGLASNPEARMWIWILAVVVAPPFEELIFRGLIYRGLRSSLSVSLSIVASAAIFAVVHPPVSALPVFGLGLAAAFAFERTGLLIAPIAAHVVYNAAMGWMQ